MIGLLIMVLLILSAVGSLLWALPSRGERRQAEMRQNAMQSGLSVTTLSVPDSSERGRIDNRNRLVTLYRKRCRGQLAAPAFTVLRSGGESGYGLRHGWVWQDKAYRLSSDLREPLQDILERLPDYVDVICIGPEGPALSFHENQDSQRVEVVVRCLDELQSLFFVK